MANTSWRQFIVHLTILVVFTYCMKAVLAQPPEPPPGHSTSPGDSTQPVPGDAGQPDAGFLAAGGAVVDDIKPEGASGAVTSTDGAWGCENTTSSALDAVQPPLPENQERQSRREQWMRERAVASDGAVQVQPPGPSLSLADSTQQVPGDAGQPNAGPLGAGGGGAEGGDDIKSEGWAGISPDGAWGGANTTCSALDAVQPLAENPEHQSRRKQWMREWADPGSYALSQGHVQLEDQEGAELNTNHVASWASAAPQEALSQGHVQLEDQEGAELNTNHVASWASAAPQEALSQGHVQLEDQEGAELNTNHVASWASAAPQEALSQGHVQLEDQEGAELNTNHVASLASAAESTLGIHVRDGAGLCAPPDALNYGQNHSVHPQSHCDPWLNIHMRCGNSIQHPDWGDCEYVDLAWERSQRAAARRHGRGGQRPWNIQPEDDSTRTVDMQQARRPRRIMQGGVLLLVLLQVLVVMYMVLVFDTRLLHAQLNGHLQGDCRNAQHAVMDFRQLQVVVCLLVLAIWIIM